MLRLPAYLISMILCLAISVSGQALKAQPISMGESLHHPLAAGQGVNIPTHLLEALGKRGKPVVQELTPDKAGRYYKRFLGHIVVPNGDEPFGFNFLYYAATTMPGMAAPPLVFIYTGIGGISVLEKRIAHALTKQGISVVISHYFNEDEALDLEKNNINTLKTLRAGLALADYFSTRTDVDCERFALIGISYGGMRGVYHTLIDPRIKKAALMVAGGPLSEIMAYSRLPKVAEIRRNQMKKAGLVTVAEYLRILRERNEFQLEDFVGSRSPQDFYLFISTKDIWVPSGNQWNLWHLLSQPRYEAFNAGHVETPLWVTLTRLKRILTFFLEGWAAGPRPITVSEEKAGVDALSGLI